MTKDEANAAKCRQLAANAADPSDRNRWMAMARFWLQRSRGFSEPEEESETDLVKS